MSNMFPMSSYFCFFFPSHWNINTEFIALKSPKILRYLPCVSSQAEAIRVLILHCIINFALYLLYHGNCLLCECICFLLCSLLQADFTSFIHKKSFQKTKVIYDHLSDFVILYIWCVHSNLSSNTCNYFIAF